jgi:tRNA threonylcarbamoyladenosine biosynthesis protein TsaB
MNSTPKILHLETSTEICSIAISQADRVLATKVSLSGFEHSAKGTLLVQACLEEAQLKMQDLAAVSISEGPGSYTGLRVGFAMAKGFCYAYDLKLICVPTLLALAEGVPSDQSAAVITPMLDARRMEVYAASYNMDGEELRAVEAVVLNEDTYKNYFGDNAVNIFVGNGAHKVESWLREGQDHVLKKGCNAADQRKWAHRKHQEGAFSDIAYAVPLYLKPPNITISKKNLLL